jgi:hypothetical protein
MALDKVECVKGATAKSRTETHGWSRVNYLFFKRRRNWFVVLQRYLEAV